MKGQRSHRDHVIAAFFLVAYVALVLAVLPTADYARMLGGAVVLTIAVVIAARVTRDKPPPSFSVFVVSVISGAVLVMPGFSAMGGHNGPALPIGFAGVQALAMLWATLISPELPPVDSKIGLRAALYGAFAGATGLSLIATIPLALMLITDSSRALPYLFVYPAYFLGACSAALVFFAFRAIAHRPVGQYLIGALGGTCLYAAVAPIVYISKGEAIHFAELLAVGATCGFLVGPPVALAISRNEYPDEE